MKKTIITISRQFGSGGRSIAKQLSQKLGVPYYDKEIIEMVGEKTGFHPDYVAQRGEHAPHANTFAYAFIGRSPNGLSNDDMLWKAQCRVIEELAQKGPCVILGRCADYLLCDREDVFNVFIYAPKAFRAKRVVEKYGEKFDFTDTLNEIKASFVRRLDTSIKKSGINKINYDRIIYTGGGALALKEQIKLGHNEVIYCDAQLANARGFWKFTSIKKG